LYRQFYEVKDSYELVIDNPSGQEVDAHFASHDVTMTGGEGQLVPEGQRIRFQGKDSRRFVFKIGASLATRAAALPRVEIDSLPVAVRFSGMRLPLAAGATTLPAEPAGLENLPEVTREASAFIRRVEEDGQSDRRIVGGNPQFEQVLREWGYLNDR
jgi:hypothetical protein